MLLLPDCLKPQAFGLVIPPLGKPILDASPLEYFPRRSACSLEPRFQVRDLHAVETRFADLHAQCARVQRGFPATFRATELLHGQGSGLIKALGSDFGDVFHAVPIAKADEASARLAHRSSLRLSPYLRHALYGLPGLQKANL
jgi:hypothetical protein